MAQKKKKQSKTKQKKKKKRGFHRATTKSMKNKTMIKSAGKKFPYEMELLP
jgi:hypothetical protein